MKLNIAGVYPKRKPLKSGEIKTYYYHRAIGKRLPDDPDSPEFNIMRKELDAKPIGVAPAGRTFKDLKKEFIVSTEFTELKENTRSENLRHIAYPEPVLGKFLVTAIQPIHAEKLMQKFAARPTLAKAIRRTLSVMLSYTARILKWMPLNPLILPPTRGGKPSPQTGQKPYEEHEIRDFRLKNPLGTRARLTFEIALGTALRREDLIRVRVADLMQSTFGIIAGKNGETIVFSVTAMMRKACLAYVAARKAAGLPESKYALCSERGTKLHKRTVSLDMEEAFEAAGFDKDQRIHALRYTAATRLLEAGFSYPWIQELTGHRMAAMAKKYKEKKRRAPVTGQTFDRLDARIAAHEGENGSAGEDDIPPSRISTRKTATSGTTSSPRSKPQVARPRAGQADRAPPRSSGRSERAR